MSKQILPTISICSLANLPSSPGHFIADHFEHYLSVHHDLHFPHKHSFYHLVYFSAGSGSHSIDFVRFPVAAGQIYFMVPGQVHTWSFDTAPNGYIVNFAAQYLHQFIADPRYLDQFSFFSGVATQQVIDLPEPCRQQVAVLLQTIVAEGNSDHGLKDDFARAALVQLFIQVSRSTGAGSSQQQFQSLLLQQFRKLITQHYHEKKLTRDYAEMLHVTPNHLNAVCKQITGSSAGILIRDRILLEAKRLLVNAELTIAQIAAELQFADNSYFTRFFRKYEGTTPEIFRKQMINR